MIPDSKRVPKVSLAWDGGYVEWFEVSTDAGGGSCAGWLWEPEATKISRGSISATRYTIPARWSPLGCNPKCYSAGSISLWQVVESDSDIQIHLALEHELRNK